MNTNEALGLAVLSIDIVQKVTAKIAAALEGNEPIEAVTSELQALRSALSANDAAADAALKARFGK